MDLEKLDKYLGKMTEEVNLNSKGYLSATKKQLEAYNKFGRLYMDEQNIIFMNKIGKTATKSWIKHRDKIADCFAELGELLAKHYQMAKGL